VARPPAVTAPGASPLRILCLSNMHPGPDAPDLGVFVADMCDALRARGHRVEVAAISTRARGRLRTPAKYAGLAARAAAPARRADVVYAHGLFPAGAAAGLWGRAWRRPWVVTAHGQDVANLVLAPVRAASAPGLRGAAALIAVSGFLLARIRAAGVPVPPAHVIDMGVAMDRFTPGDRGAARAALGVPPGGPLVVAVGSLIPRKNPLGLLEAVAAARVRAPDLRVALVGDGPLRDEVAARAAALGIAGAVLRPGLVPHAAVRDWMRAADVLAVPSLVEPLGQVALEALACGRPVVATAHGGTAEVLTPDVGRVVDPADPAALAAAILETVAAPPDPARCRAVAAGHALDVQAARVEAVLHAAVRDRGGPGRRPGAAGH